MEVLSTSTKGIIISHDNIREINTWKCPIHTVHDGYDILYQPSVFSMGDVRYSIGDVSLRGYPNEGRQSRRKNDEW